MPRARWPAPARSASDRPLHVLFVHPAYPSQFTAIAAELNRLPGFACSALVHQMHSAAVAAHPPTLPHFGFLPDGAPNGATYPLAQGFESGLRCGRGVAHAFRLLRARQSIDAVVGHAAFGTTIFLRPFVEGALLSYAELPGYQSLAARPEFPITPEAQMTGSACEALVYTSMLSSDLGIVPSAHARRQFPAELQPKLRVQMEGFETIPRPADVPAARAALGLPATGPLVGFFGRTLEAVRGFDVFVEFARRLHAVEPDVHFLVIGDEHTLYGNETTYLGGRSFKRYALDRAGVPDRLFHWRPTLPTETFRHHIACLDLAVMPYFEGAANWSLFEAMAAGLPLLASNRGFVAEALRDGHDALLLDPYAVDAYVRCAQLILRDRALGQRLGQAARQRLQRQYSIPRAARGYAEIIREAVARRSAQTPALHAAA